MPNLIITNVGDADDLDPALAACLTTSENGDYVAEAKVWGAALIKEMRFTAVEGLMRNFGVSIADLQRRAGYE